VYCHLSRRLDYSERTITHLFLVDLEPPVALPVPWTGYAPLHYLPALPAGTLRRSDQYLGLIQCANGLLSVCFLVHRASHGWSGGPHAWSDWRGCRPHVVLGRLSVESFAQRFEGTSVGQLCCGSGTSAKSWRYRGARYHSPGQTTAEEGTDDLDGRTQVGIG
jgi:hypothetical protein